MWQWVRGRGPRGMWQISGGQHVLAFPWRLRLSITNSHSSVQNKNVNTVPRIYQLLFGNQKQCFYHCARSGGIRDEFNTLSKSFAGQSLEKSKEQKSFIISSNRVIDFRMSSDWPQYFRPLNTWLDVTKSNNKYLLYKSCIDWQLRPAVWKVYMISGVWMSIIFPIDFSFSFTEIYRPVHQARCGQSTWLCVATWILIRV